MAYKYDKNLEFLRDIPVDDLKDLADLLDVKIDKKNDRYVEKIIEELQLFGGDTIENFIEGFGASYRTILCDVCSALEVSYEKYWDVGQIERSLLDKVLGDNKDLIHEKGHENIIKDTKLGVFDKMKLSVKNVFSKSSRPIDDFIFISLDCLDKNDIKILAKKILFPNKGGILTGPAYRKTVPAVLQIALLRVNNIHRNAISCEKECVEILSKEEQDKLIKSWEVKSNNQDNLITPIIVDLATKATGEIARDVAVIKEGSELLRCSVSPKMLAKAKDGESLLGIIHGEKGIVKQARFNTADLSKVVSPALLYNAASIALGCHFMLEIKNELGSINEKLNKILKYLTDNDKSIIETCIRELWDINSKKHKSSSDELRLRSIEFKADRIRRSAMKKITDQNNKTDDAISWLNMYIMAEKAFQYSEFLLWQYFCEIADEDRAQEHLNILLKNENILIEDYQKLPIDNLKEAYHFAIKNNSENETLQNLKEFHNVFEHKLLSEITIDYYICFDESKILLENK